MLSKVLMVCHLREGEKVIAFSTYKSRGQQHQLSLFSFFLFICLWQMMHVETAKAATTATSNSLSLISRSASTATMSVIPPARSLIASAVA